MNVITLHIIVMPILQGQFLSLASFEKANFHVVESKWRRPDDQEPSATFNLQSIRNKPRFQPLARNWILATTERVTSRHFPNSSAGETTATASSLIATLGDPKLRTQVNHFWTSNPCEIINVCCFKALSWWYLFFKQQNITNIPQQIVNWCRK